MNMLETIERGRTPKPPRILCYGVEGIGKSAGVFNVTKLDWLNQQYMKSLPASIIADRLRPFLAKVGAPPPDDAPLERIVALFQERASTLVEMAELSAFLFKDDNDLEYNAKAKKKHLKGEAAHHLGELKKGLSALDDWSVEAIEKVFTDYLESNDVKLGKVAQPVRVALTGGTVSPGIYETVFEVGKASTLARMDRAIAVAGVKSEEEPAS